MSKLFYNDNGHTYYVLFGQKGETVLYNKKKALKEELKRRLRDDSGKSKKV